jgi:tetratricopeptide (TPR) repeat protein
MTAPGSLVAIACALTCFAVPAVMAQSQDTRVARYLSLSEIHRHHGRPAEAAAVLERLDAALAPQTLLRLELADAYARLGRLDQAASVRKGVRASGADPGSDETMKLARLYEKVGRNADALKIWRALWRDRLSDAQRKVVEERLTSLAVTLARPDELATELDARCRSGKCDLHDVGLLIRLHVRAAKPSQALSAADEFLPRVGASPLHIYKERARIYRELKDEEGFEREMHRVLAADPAGKPAHLRSLILNELDRSREAGTSRVRALLDELAASDPVNSSLAFEAGVLVRAGLIDDAIVAYRQAAALAPDVADNHLLLTDALLKRGAPAAALAHSQWLAATARTPVAFMGAMDALLNVNGSQRQEDPTGRRTRALFRWSQRQIVEQLVHAKDGRYLFPLQTEFAEGAGDTLRSYAAVENSLAVADDSRSAVLRQLITLASPIEGDVETESRGLILDGDKLRERYGRRLLALREALPPSVYVDAGRDLLIQRDARAAAHAFELARAEDRGPTVTARIAGIHDSAGLHARALTLYREAFAAEPGDLTLMSRFADLLGRIGDRDEAHALHAATVLAILSRLPSGPGSETRDVTYEFKTFYAPAVRGFLATWPAQGGIGGLEPFTRLLDADPGLRAQKTAEFLRRVYFATGNPRPAAQLQEQADGEREAWGYSSPSGEQPAFEAALARAKVTMLFNPPLSLSVLNGDQDQMLAATRSWALGIGSGGAVLEAVDWADHGRLDARRFALLCREVAQRLREDSDLRTQVWGGGGDSRVLESLERAIGGPLLSSAKWMEHIGQEAAASPMGFYVPPRRTRYLMARLSDEDRMLLIQRAAVHPDAALTALPLWRELLKVPIGPDVAASVEASMRTFIGAIPPETVRRAADWITGQLIEADADPGNFALQRAVMQHWKARSRADLAHFDALDLLRSGRTDEAVAAFVQAVSRSSAGARQVDWESAGVLFEAANAVRRAFVPRYARELGEYLDEPSRASDPGIAAARVHIFHPDPRQDAEGAVASLRSAVDLDPANESFLVRLQRLYQRGGSLENSVLMLERLRGVDDVEPVYRGSLYAAYLAAGRTQDAARLNESSPEDMRHPQFLISLAQRQRSSKNPLAVALEPTYALPAAPRLSADPQALEDILRLTPIEEEGSLRRVYSQLAEAYAGSGQTTAKLGSLFERIAQGEANVRETTLWMSLLARAGSRLDDAAVSVLDEHLEAGNEIPAFRLMLIARLYAVSGRERQALQAYRLAAAQSLGWAADVLGVMQLGGEAPLTVAELLKEARANLNPEILEDLIAGVKRLMKPRPNAGRRIREAYHRAFPEEPPQPPAAGEEVWPEPSDEMSEQRYLTVIGATGS